MSITTRAALAEDAAQMAAILNEIIEVGGTTAHTDLVSAEVVAGWMANWPGQSCWTVACDADGQVMGFQSIEPHPELPKDTADIASFVSVNATGQGIGSALFRVSCAGAKALGYRKLVAVIRADNTVGLAYYSGRGFRDYDVLKDETLGNGQVVDRICKRYSLYPQD